MDQIKNLEDKITEYYDNITGVIVWKNGEKKYENYFGDSCAENRYHVYSVTKSILSILIGIAIEQGYIQSVHQKVMDFFPEYPVKKKEGILRKITLQDMLTMTVPYKRSYGMLSYIRYFMSKDWLSFALGKVDGKGKIGEFRYAPLIGPDILSAVISRTTGKSVLAFAKENLFDRLEIEVKDHIMLRSAKQQNEFNNSNHLSGWVCDSKGLNAAGWGLTLSANDMAKIGQLLLNKGNWNDKQIVSREWITESTGLHSYWKEENLSYGYLWWSLEHGFAAIGDGGNVIYVNRDKKLVVAITAKLKPNVFDRIDFIEEYIEPIDW